MTIDHQIDHEDRGRCDGCGEWFDNADTTAGEAGTRWCSACVAAATEPAPASEEKCEP